MADFMDQDTFFDRFYGLKYFLRQISWTKILFWQILWTKILFVTDFMDHDTFLANFMCMFQSRCNGVHFTIYLPRLNLDQPLPYLTAFRNSLNLFGDIFKNYEKVGFVFKKRSTLIKIYLYLININLFQVIDVGKRLAPVPPPDRKILFSGFLVII